MKEFARAILSDPEDKLTCSACQAQLAEYVDAQIMGLEPGESFAEVERHLQICPHCAQAYDELLALTTAAYTGTIPQPAHQPRFDFSFLETEAGPFWRWDELGRFILAFSESLLQTLSPPPAPALAGIRDEGAGAQGLYQLDLSEEMLGELGVTVTIYEAPEAPDSCEVRLRIRQPGKSFPDLEGIRVVLRLGERSQAEETDAFGRVVFGQVPRADLSQMSLEITSA